MTLPEPGDLNWGGPLNDAILAAQADAASAKADAASAKTDAAYAKNVVNSVGDVADAVSTAEDAATTATSQANAASGSASAAASNASLAQDERVAAEAARDAAEAAQAAAEAVPTTNDTIIAGRINTPGSATATALTASIAGKVNAVVDRTRADAFASSTEGAVITCAPASSALAITTPDGGGNVTHPSVYFNPRGWNGKRYWLAITPYDGTTTDIENPCIYSSDDGINWAAPAGLTNPIEGDPAGSNYNSDPHLTEGPDGRLYCFWRLVGSGTETIYYRASADGVDWSDKQTVYTAPQSTRRLVAPAFCYVDGIWHMWAVDIVPTPNTVVHLTATSLTGAWSAPTVVTGLSTPSGREPWHLDVQRIGSEFVMLFMDVTLNGSDGGTLYRAVSRQGDAFVQDAEPFLVPTGGAFSLLYRSCLVPARIKGRDGYEVFYSGITTGSYKLLRTIAMIGDTRPRQDDPDKLAAAINKYAGYAFGDVISRADSSTVPGTASSGQTYTVDTGTIGVASKLFYLPSAANSRMMVDVGLADVEYGFTLGATPSNSQQQWGIVRGQDASNYIRFGLSGTGSWFIQKIVGGAATTLAGISTGLLPQASGQRVRIVCSGSTLSMYVDGRLIATATDSSFSTATKVGIQSNQTAVRWGNLYAKTP